MFANCKMPPCVRIASLAAQKTRRVPPYIARDCLGKVKRGGDKRLYIAKKSKGVCRWILVKDEDEEEEVVVRVVRRRPAKRTRVTRQIIYLDYAPSKPRVRRVTSRKPAIRQRPVRKQLTPKGPAAVRPLPAAVQRKRAADWYAKNKGNIQ